MFRFFFVFFLKSTVSAWSLNQKNLVASVVDESNEEILRGLHTLYVTRKDLNCFLTFEG